MTTAGLETPALLRHRGGMQRYQPPMVALAVCLAALAGFVDALAYSSLGGFFASFMSGNSTRLGVALAAGHFDEVRMAGALILSFVSGVMVATVIARAWPLRARSAVMGAVTLLIGLAAAIAQVRPGSQALLLLAAAMGAENGLFTREGEVSIGLTYMTGALVRMAQRLTGALMGDADRWTWLRYLLLWLGFLLGVVTGGRCFGAFGGGALWLAAAAAGVLAIWFWMRPGEKEQAGPWGPRAE